MTSTSSAATPADPSKQAAKHIANPRRLLILTPTSQSLFIIPPFLHSLTGVPVVDPPQHETTPDPQSQTPPTTSHNPPSPLAAPAPITTTSFAGYTTHSPLRLDTKYYSAEVPVWVDEIPLSTKTSQATADTPSQGQWCTEFLGEEAEIVRDAVGALVVCVRNPEQTAAPGAQADDPAQRADVCVVRDLLRDIGAVKSCIDEERGGMSDVPGVFVLVGSRNDAARAAAPSTSQEEDAGLDLGVDDADLGDSAGDVPFSVGWWEDQLFDMGLFGWEVVEWDPTEQGAEKTRNKFGDDLLFGGELIRETEYEGMPRIQEVLETHDWSASSGLHDADDAGLDFSDDLEEELLGFGRSSHTRGFGHEVQELEREMLGLRMAIERGGGDGDESNGEESGGDEGDEELKVESIETLMMRMQAVRDMGSDLPEGERRKFAAKAVSDIMREL
ncbi:uncharacterized protein N7482_004539 [Penicillium canariense]|uniref:Alpha/gamma-adaptin-binding protein p34 n=1 Tax=Penicillium canariense TaxID=189055 RepID=A0A9W9I6T3_9EURO|nr:uncharacterized protein N7482_004539 [Penicillium canariense]KAJ5168945.1 hypothetical protein N7482_004539 [Penicillium canariense]